MGISRFLTAFFTEVPSISAASGCAFWEFEMKGTAGLWMPFTKVGMFLQNFLPHLFIVTTCLALELQGSHWNYQKMVVIRFLCNYCKILIDQTGQVSTNQQ